MIGVCRPILEAALDLNLCGSLPPPLCSMFGLPNWGLSLTEAPGLMITDNLALGAKFTVQIIVLIQTYPQS